MNVFYVSMIIKTSIESVYSNVDGGAIRSSVYNLLPSDLRIAPSECLGPLLTSSNASPLLSSSLPTLLLFECVLVYMTPAASSSLIRWFADYLDPSNALGAIVYEMFGLDDAFGRMMLSNLKKVGLPRLPVISKKIVLSGDGTAKPVSSGRVSDTWVSINAVH